MEILLFIYLAIGFIYAIYLFWGGYSPWYAFFINVAFGPITLPYTLYFTYKKAQRKAQGI